MEDKKSRRGVELLKTVLIVLLTLSALSLMGRTQTDNGMPSFVERAGGFLQQFFGYDTSADGPDSQAGLSAGLHPVRMAVCNENGRYGIQYETELADSVFEEKLGSLLGDALAEAGTPSQVPESEWRAALEAGKAGIYYDFLGSVPLPALSAWLGGEENGALSGEARRFLLASGTEDTATLYYCGEDGLYYARRTGLSVSLRLKPETEAYTPNQAVFAFEQQERYPNLDPYVLILSDMPQPSVYQASNPIGPNISDDSLNQLLKALSFHPQTSSVYQAADGLVVREGTDTLRLSDGGVVVYHAASDESPRYIAKEAPELAEAVEAARVLCLDGFSGWCGSAGLYLIQADRQDDGSIEVYFGYLLDGAAVELYDDGYAARIVVRSGYISDYVLRYRTYQKTDSFCAVLPEIQAAAAMRALETKGNELLLCYPDGGGTGQVTAGWIAK